jgi:hypothetical protein
MGSLVIVLVLVLDLINPETRTTTRTRRRPTARIDRDALGFDQCFVIIGPVPIAAPRCLSLHKDGGASRLSNDRSRSGTLRGLSPMTTLAPLRPKRVPPRDRYRCCHR